MRISQVYNMLLCGVISEFYQDNYKWYRYTLSGNPERPILQTETRTKFTASYPLSAFRYMTNLTIKEP